ncbi:MAG TPA: phosphopantetheine-binding protein [Kofleriaceae bacterium]|nr:phosphopantetheine-binding protein [Kofleriaceae bacterium]
MSVAVEIESFLVTEILPGRGIDSVARDDDLLEVVDSLAIVELIAFLEEKYGIKVGDDDLDPANFSSIDRIVAFVDRKGS